MQRVIPFPWKSFFEMEEAEERREKAQRAQTIFEMGFAFKKLPNKWPPKSNALVMRLMMYKVLNHTDTDVAIVIGNKFIKCHSIVLNAYSAYFEKSRHQFEVILPEQHVSLEGFSLVYLWMLRADPQPNTDSVMECLTVAKFLKIEELKLGCENYFDNIENCNEHTAFQFYCEARRLNVNDEAAVMLSRIQKCFLSVVASKHYADMPFEHVSQLLGQKLSCVNNEAEIFYAAVVWLDADWVSRKSKAAALMERVEFSMMPEWFLHSITYLDCGEQIDRLQKDETILKMLTTARFALWQIEGFYKGLVTLETLLSKNINPPKRRQWIYDELCDYHAKSPGGELGQLTYQIFLVYLTKLRNAGLLHWQTLKTTSVEKKSSMGINNSDN